ncbi:MAG TPA: hypothetical protein VF153_05225 [Candidatus Limnocylindria bacterium]
MTATTFSDRVMAAVAFEPAPSATRSLLAALRSGSWADASASIHTAWHLATVRTWRIAPPARARAIALMLTVLMALGAGGVLAASTAVRIANSIGSVSSAGPGADGPLPAGHPTVTQDEDSDHSPSDEPTPTPQEHQPASQPTDEDSDEADEPSRTHEDGDSHEDGDEDGANGDEDGANDGDADESEPEDDGGADQPGDDGETSGGDGDESSSSGSSQQEDGDSSNDSSDPDDGGTDGSGYSGGD